MSMELGIRRISYGRAFLVAGLLAAASAFISPAFAQVSLRMDPNQVSIDPNMGVVNGFDVVVDNVPATDANGVAIGLTGVSMRLTFSKPECFPVLSHTVDSDLVTSWGGSVSTSDSFTRDPNLGPAITWILRTNNPVTTGPSGDVRLGRINFTYSSTVFGCGPPLPVVTGDFNWEETTTRYSTTRAPGNASPSRIFSRFIDGPWFRGTIPDVDFTIACDRQALVNANELTLRFDPVPLAIDQDANAITTASVYLDNVPAFDANGTVAGLTAFNVAFNIDDRLDCLDFIDATLDPDLEAEWGGSTTAFSTAMEDPNVPDSVSWDAFTDDLLALGPSGSVKLGEVTFRIGGLDAGGAFDPNRAAACEALAQGDGILKWNATLSSYTLAAAPDNTDPNNHLPITTLRDTRWGLNSAPYVDGDRITLQCVTTNLGTQNAVGSFPQQTAVISTDTIVDSGDTIITQQSLGTQPAGGVSVTRVLSGTPQFGSAGARKVCAKVDTDPQSLNNQEGVIRYESDETNNVDCLDTEVLFPLRDLNSDANTLTATPGPLDPNAIHAGNIFSVGFDITNKVATLLAGQGNAVVRGHTNSVYLSSDATINPSDPNDKLICEFVESASPGIAGGATRRRTFGINPDPNNPTDLACDIPFTAASSPAGVDYFIGVVLDSKNNVIETNESNNIISTVMPIKVFDPLPPNIRPATVNDLANTRSVIRGSFSTPTTSRVPLTITGVRNLASFSIKFTWSDPNQITIQSPASNISFSTFLEQNGRVQNCTRDTSQIASGTIIVACTTTGTGAGATSSVPVNLANLFFTALKPGPGGNFTIDPDPNVTFAKDPNGVNLLDPNTSITNGTFVVTGNAELFIENVSIPSEIYPGRIFSASYTISNKGFGAGAAGTRSEVILSSDTNINTATGDKVVCFRNEATALAADSNTPVTLTNCVLTDDLLPGQYTGAIRVGTGTPILQPVSLPSRIFAIKSANKGRVFQAFSAPPSLGAAHENPFASAVRFGPRSAAMLRSVARNTNFTQGWVPKSDYPRLNLFRTPHDMNTKLPVLASLRAPRSDKAALTGADIDGDGDDELVLLQKTKQGDVLDFRVIDYKLRIPVTCVTMAESPRGFFSGSVVDVAAVNYDSDPEDELAVVEEMGNGTQTLTIYDVVFPMGVTPPPPTSCTEPTSPILPPVTVDLVPLASDPMFGTSGDKVQGLCGIDFGLDGVDEIVTLQGPAKGTQALRVWELPAGIGGTAVLLSEDASFAGTGGNRRALTISCTR